MVLKYHPLHPSSSSTHFPLQPKLKATCSPDNFDRFDGILPSAVVGRGFAREAGDFLVPFTELEVEADVGFRVGVALLVVARDVNGTRDARDQVTRNPQLLGSYISGHVPGEKSANN